MKVKFIPTLLRVKNLAQNILLKNELALLLLQQASKGMHGPLWPSTPLSWSSMKLHAHFGGLQLVLTPKKGVNTSLRPPKWACNSIEDQERGVDGHKGTLMPFEACWSRTRASPFLNKLFRAQIHVFF